MDAEQWSRARALFERALELHGDERERLLVESCHGDPGLDELVRKLLAEDVREGYLDPPGHRAFPGGAGEPADGSRLGPYLIERRLGGGGMGTVYLAARADGHFEKSVALKLIKRGMDTEHILQRFHNERQVLANLEHEGIARLLDGGADDDGRPYLVMEFVDGQPIDEHCAANGLSVRERVELFRGVCDAVHFAHQGQVVHRDIKPSNILVTRDGTPKLLDFGIAKVLDPGATPGLVDATVTGVRPMTPEYASPEQVLGKPITTASDVYSLGVVLYELLSGCKPYELADTTPAELERVVCERDPPRPSSAVTAGDAGARTLRSRLTGDLDTIVLKALRKEPERRYASAHALSDDLRRHLEGLPVSARADTWTYRTSRFVRRNKTLVGGVVSVLLALVIGLIVSTDLYLAAETARKEGRYREYLTCISAATLALQSRDVSTARPHLEAAPIEHRGWEWRHLMARLDRSELTLVGHAAAVKALAFSPDGRWLASGDQGQVVLLWDVETGAEVARWGPHDGWVQDLVFTPDGSTLLALSSRRTLRLWSVEERMEIGTWSLDAGSPNCLALDVERNRAATGGMGGALNLWDATTGAHLRSLPAHDTYVSSVCFRADGRELVSASLDGTLRVHDVESGEAVRMVDLGSPVRDLAIEPGGDRLALVLGDGALVVSSADGEPLLRIAAHSDSAEGVAWSPDGAHIATGSRDRTVQVWDAESGDRVALLLGHTGRHVWDLDYHPDGRLASGAEDGSVKVWGRGAADVPSLAASPGYAADVTLSADGTQLASVGGDDGMDFKNVELDLWRRATRTREQHWKGPVIEGIGDFFLPGRTAAFDASGARVAVTSGDGFVVLDTRSGAVLLEASGLGHDIHGLAFLPDGVGLLSAGPHRLRVWDLTDGSLVRSSPPADAWIRALAAGRERLVTSLVNDDDVIVWDADSLQPTCVLSGHTDRVWGVALSRDETRAATASSDGSARVWDARTGRELGSLAGPGGAVICVAFSPDGERIVTDHGDTTLTLWDAERMTATATLWGHTAQITAVEFSADGSCIVSKSADGRIRIWDSIAAQ